VIDIASTPALDLARRIADGQLSAEQIADATALRVADLEPVVQAWAHFDPERMRSMAAATDRRAPASALHGIPIGVKDVIDTADMPTELGSELHTGRRPEVDAACVRALRQAGLVIAGKTVTAELATWHPGPTTNPHDPARTPGGSSSGSAAAVGAGMVPLAIGTQTVGSTIRPASFCGVWAFRPSLGRLALDGVLQLSETLDTLGLFAADASDLRTLAHVLGVPQPLPAPPVRRVLFLRTPWWSDAAPASRAVVQQAADRLSDAGTGVTDDDAGWMEPLLAAHVLITEFDVARSLQSRYEQHPDALSNELGALIERGLSRTDTERQAALEVRRRGRTHLERLLRPGTVIVAPAVTDVAPRGLQATGDARFCQPWSLLGTPIVAWPAGAGQEGLPIGVQLIGAGGSDGDLLAFAAQVATRA
jgi:amidase